MNIAYFLPLLILVLGLVGLIKGWKMLLTKGSFKRGLAWMVFTPLITVIAVAVSIGIVAPTKEQLAIEAAEAADQAAEDKLAGLHCTSVFWRMRDTLKAEYLRDPDSYDERSRDYGIIEDGKRIFTLAYQAKNGFGGMNQGSFQVLVNQETCEVVEVITTE